MKYYYRKEELIPSKTIKRALPQNYQEGDKDVFPPLVTDNFPEVCIYYLKNVYVLNDSLLKGFRFLDRHTHIFPLKIKNKLKKLALLLLRGKKMNKIIWPLNEWSIGYFHWFIDVLPKLIAADSLIKGYKIPLPERARKEKYIEDSLGILGYDFFYYKERRSHKVKDMLLIDQLQYCDPDIMPRLRDKLRAKEAQSCNKKIFISRARAQSRRILNENEVLEILKEFGFEVHHFENYNLARQIELMGQCSFLLSVHGAGLTNMLFMNPGTNVMELRKEGDNINGCYYSLANSLDIDYSYLWCKGTHEITQKTDFIVDTGKLRDALSIMSREKVS